MSRIAVIGAGFSGALVTIHLLRRSLPGDRITLIERRPQFGRGLAYATGNPNHLLNVRAGNMSAFSDQPGHFVAWLRRQSKKAHPAIPDPIDETGFVSRQLYGAYMQELLGEHVWRLGYDRSLHLVADEAIGIARKESGLGVQLARGAALEVDNVVLALGNFPPGRSEPGFVRDPWDGAVLEGIGPTSTVLLIGTGLTMVDTVIGLLARRHAGRIVAISRRGLLPQGHKSGYRPYALPDAPDAQSLSRLLQRLRRAARALEREGGDWRAVVDGLRPWTQRLWRDMPAAERARFLRHLRPWWEVHRHRMAPDVARRIAEAKATGQLSIRRAELLAVEQLDATVKAWILPRGSNAPERLKVERVIDCTGLQSDLSQVGEPLLRNLLRDGVARLDRLRLGLDVTIDGAVRGSTGQGAADIFAVGPITKGTFWEINAVPDIRIACEKLAEHLVAIGAVGAAALPEPVDSGP